MVEDAGGAFFLIHVATPLEECERRDRKGLYAKARRGEIPEFTGISSPYEEPDDAAVRVDTTGRTIEAALDDVLEALAESGHLDLRTTRFGRSARTRAEPCRRNAPPRPLRLHRQHLPLGLHASRPRTRAGRRRAGSSFTSAGTHGLDAHPMDAVMAATLERRRRRRSGASRLTRELVEGPT